MSTHPNLSRYHYQKSKSTNKRKPSSTSSASDTGGDPDLRTSSKQEKKKQRQVSSVQIEEMASSISLEEIYAQLGKLATREDIQKVREELTKVSDALIKRVDILESRLFEIEGEKDKLRQEVKKLKDDNLSLHDQLDQRKKEVTILRAAQNDHEQHGRSWNVRVYGVREEKGGEETAEACLQKCVTIFNEQVGVAVSDCDIEVVHRSGKPGGSKPRPILVRFFSRRKKGQILAARRKLKNSGISISEDLTRANYQLLTKAHKHSATMAAWSANGKVLAKIKNGKTLQITIDDDLDELFSKAMS